MSAVTQDELMAFADGELPEARMAAIAALLEHDAALQARLDAILANDDQIRGAFAEILDAPVPPELIAQIRAAEPSASTSSASTSNVINLTDARTARRWPGGNWATGLSMAASLAVGLLVGSQFLAGPGVNDAGSGAMVVAAADGPIAAPQLASVLFTLPSGATQPLDTLGQARMSISFQDGDGRLCRQFSVEGAAGATDGAACLQAGQWRIEAVGGRATDGSSDGFRTASGEAAEPVLAAVDALIAGEPLDAAAEAKALKAALR